VCFIENRLDVRHACRPRQLLRLTMLELALYHLLGKLPEPESTHDFF
jgi:hypothetical protein